MDQASAKTLMPRNIEPELLSKKPASIADTPAGYDGAPL